MVPPAKTRPSSGFTLVELLVVIAIIGMLVAILLPAVQAARASARKTLCQNNLRQIGLALTNYESAHRVFPPGQTWTGPRDEPGTVDYAWSALILPQLEETAVYDQLDFDTSYLSEENRGAARHIIPMYLCPSTSLRSPDRTEDDRLANLVGHPGVQLGCIDYLGISGPDKDATNPVSNQEYGPQKGVLIGTKGLIDGSVLRKPPAIKVSSISDGLTHTICLTECAGRGMEDDGDPHGAWVSGKNITHIDKGVNEKSPKKSWEDERIYSQHSGGAYALYCGGAVALLNEDTDEAVIKALCSRNGGEKVELD